MDQSKQKKVSYSIKPGTLGKAEKLVYDVLVNGSSRPDDLTTIAKLCHLTHLEVSVAIQLLIHKKMLPTEKNILR